MIYAQGLAGHGKLHPITRFALQLGALFGKVANISNANLIPILAKPMECK